MAPHNFGILIENFQSNQSQYQSTFPEEEGTPITTSSSNDSISESDESGASTSCDSRTYSPITIPTIMTIQQMLIDAVETYDLESVKEIEFQIQDEDTSLQKLSSFLPNLYKINLYGSVIKTIRALGSDLDNLKVLNIDVGPCAFTPKIKTLNLNNNKVSDIQCVGFLSLCLELRHIYLENCPVSKNPDYRCVIKYLVPQLVSLDGQSFGVAAIRCL